MPDAAPDALRVVLFGLPGAGKSSLLAALPQAAGSSPNLLNGHLIDPSPNLLELHRAIDRGPPPEESEQVVPYSFRYEPGGAPGGRGAVVLDPSGPAAEALVRDQDAGPLAPEMRQADAVVLAVDASASPEELDAVFAEFDRFLRRMEQGRGDRTDVGGLPIFLVLTKCDLLAQPGGTTADWLEHIEERKREVAARFHAFRIGRARRTNRRGSAVLICTSGRRPCAGRRRPAPPRTNPTASPSCSTSACSRPPPTARSASVRVAGFSA